jgi:hypothetical protein
MSGETKQEEQQEEILKLKQKHEADLALIREDMNLKFDHIFSLIQQNPLLTSVKPEVLRRKIT